MFTAQRHNKQHSRYHVVSKIMTALRNQVCVGKNQTSQISLVVLWSMWNDPGNSC